MAKFDFNEIQSRANFQRWKKLARDIVRQERKGNNFGCSNVIFRIIERKKRGDKLAPTVLQNVCKPINN